VVTQDCPSGFQLENDMGEMLVITRAKEDLDGELVVEILEYG
jgi:hypothetical protein